MGIGELPVFIRFNNTEGAMREKNENETLTSELIFHLSRSAWGNRNPKKKSLMKYTITPTRAFTNIFSGKTEKFFVVITEFDAISKIIIIS